MQFDLADILGWLWVPVSGIAGWLWKEIHNLRSELSSHRTHTAERYVTKEDMNNTFDRVYASLDRIEKKLDVR